MQPGKPLKIGIVLVGYVLALLVALAVSHIRAENTPASASQGMSAFGDLILFLGVFGLLALVPTALLLFFLRPFAGFWIGFGVLCLALTLAGPLTEIANTIIHLTGDFRSPTADVLSLLGLFYVFGSPLFFLGLLVIALVAPSGRPRLLMLLSAGFAFLTGTYALVMLLGFRRFF